VAHYIYLFFFTDILRKENISDHDDIPKYNVIYYTVYINVCKPAAEDRYLSSVT